MREGRGGQRRRYHGEPTFLHRVRSKGPKPRRHTDRFYHSTRWRKLRRYALSREPLCRDPFGEHAEWREVVSATEVDRVVPRRVRPELELALQFQLGRNGNTDHCQPS